MTYTYLASPYTHSDPAVREQRFKAACKAAARLIQEGEVVFCPIAHSHPIDLEFATPASGQFWKHHDAPFLAGAARLKILAIEGWADSVGVREEVRYAHDNGIPMEFIDLTEGS